MPTPTIQSVRSTLARYGLTPKTRLARFCLVLAVVLSLWNLFGTRTFAYWTTFFVFVLALLVVGYRSFTRRFMWQLRDRLIVTYVFIAVIPVVLLITMGIAAGYFFAGQFSTYVITTDIHNELQRLESSNRTLAYHAASHLRQRDTLDSEFLSESEAFPDRLVTAYYHGHAYHLAGGSNRIIAPAPSGIPAVAIVTDNGELYLRAVNHVRVTDSDELTLVSSVPLDKPHLESIVPNMGVLNLYAERTPDIAAQHRESNVSDSDVEFSNTPKVSCGYMPPAASRFDAALSSGTSIQNIFHWQGGAPSQLLLTVRTRPSLLYNRLFHTLGDLTGSIYSILVGIAFIFALIEIAAMVIGVRLTRTMTSSVTKLYDATQHVNAGDFSHRIQVRARDQLASLESSFNSMTESLQKLIAEQKEKQRIESELFIAKEVQDLLFPHDTADLDGLELHGICRPARTVSGDYYDFLPVSHNAAGLSVGDISGKGISAALMMATVHAFVRAHTLVEKMPAMAAARGSANPAILNKNSSCCPSPGAIFALLNEQLYRSTPAQKYATMFLGFYDQETRQLTYSNAGHLPPIVICANGSTHKLDKGGTVVGLFGDMAYADGHVTLNPGDIVVAYSDGITEPENDFGDFGEERLTQIVLENRDLPLPRISEAILNAVTDWIGGEEQPDDMTIVLARAR